MSGIYLPRLFPPHIAERGLLYFQQGKVRDVQKTSAACKHMAALWYAVRAQTPDKQADESGVQQPEIILFVSCSNTKGYLKTIFQVAFLLGADVD